MDSAKTMHGDLAVFRDQKMYLVVANGSHGYLLERTLSAIKTFCCSLSFFLSFLFNTRIHE